MKITVVESATNAKQQTKEIRFPVRSCAFLKNSSDNFAALSELTYHATDVGSQERHAITDRDHAIAARSYRLLVRGKLALLIARIETTGFAPTTATEHITTTAILTSSSILGIEKVIMRSRLHEKVLSEGIRV
jgi:hypothetical protein